MCGELALQPVSQWTATASATAEPRGDASAQAERSESPGARKLDAGPAHSPGDPQGAAVLEPGRAPGWNAEGTLGEPPGDWAAKWYWPPEEWANLWAVEGCESSHGADPATYDLTRAQAGRLQIDRRSWEDYFMETEGWPWEDVVLNDAINYQAAYIVFQRAGETWQPWPGCQP